MATTNLMGDQEHDHAARLARFAIEAAKAASVLNLFCIGSRLDKRRRDRELEKARKTEIEDKEENTQEK